MIKLSPSNFFQCCLVKTQAIDVLRNHLWNIRLISVPFVPSLFQDIFTIWFQIGSAVHSASPSTTTPCQLSCTILISPKLSFHISYSLFCFWFGPSYHLLARAFSSLFEVLWIVNKSCGRLKVPKFMDSWTKMGLCMGFIWPDHWFYVDEQEKRHQDK